MKADIDSGKRGIGRARALKLGRPHVSGISLIEVLVSVVVLGVGLLGVAAMQSVALRGGQSSLESSQAVIQTNAIVEAMRANRDNASAYNTTGLVCTAPAGGTTLATRDVNAWITDLKTTIGGSAAADTTTCGGITGCPLNCQITVRWNDQRAAGSPTREVVTRARI